MHKQTEPLASASSAEAEEAPEQGASPPEDELQISGISRVDVPRVWRFVEAGVIEVCAQMDGTWTNRDVLKAVLDKTLQLWVLHQGGDYVGFVITQIIAYPQTKACLIFMVNGKDRKKWLHFEDYLGEWAKAQGCTILESYARKGWLKVMGEQWKVTSTLVRKEL